MVCFTKPSEEEPLETVSKTAGTFKKYLAGDLKNHLSITVYHKLTLTNQIKRRRALRPVEPVGKLNSYQVSREVATTCSPSWKVISAILCSSFNENILSSYDITDAIAASTFLMIGSWLVQRLCIQPQAHTLKPGWMDLTNPAALQDKRKRWIATILALTTDTQSVAFTMSCKAVFGFDQQL